MKSNALSLRTGMMGRIQRQINSKNLNIYTKINCNKLLETDLMPSDKLNTNKKVVRRMKKNKEIGWTISEDLFY